MVKMRYETSLKIERIRDLYRKGYSDKEIMATGVSEPTYYRLKRRARLTLDDKIEHLKAKEGRKFS
jgi:hypothetical protein